MTKQKTPKWAKNLEEWGKKQEDRWNKVPKWRKSGDFVGEIFGEIISILIAIYLPVVFPNFVQSSYPALMYVVIIVSVIHIFGNLLLIIFQSKWFYYLIQSIMKAFSVVSLIVFIQIFPFNVPGGLVVIIRFALVIATVIVSIVSVSYFINAFFSFIKQLES